MSTSDDQFMTSLRATFQAEAEELLARISSLLLELEKLPTPLPLPAQAASVVENVYREAHTLKGAARAVDLQSIESLCQHMESVFSSWKRQTSSPVPESFDVLHHAIDLIRQQLSPAASAVDLKPQQENLIRRLTTLQALPPLQPPLQASPPPRQPPTIAPPPAAPAPPETERLPAGGETVRIATEKLDQLLLQTEDMLAYKIMAGQRVKQLREMTLRLELWQREWSKISTEIRALRQSVEQRCNNGNASTGLLNFLDFNNDFLRSMENRLLLLTSQSQHDHHDLSKRLDDLLEDSKKLLMLPFATLANPLTRIVRDLCRDQKKDADLVIRGGEVEIDKRILEEMKDALIHILRNSVDHGVESPDVRRQLHKSPRATITVAAAPVNGSKVEITIADDGSGIDLQRVKESAINHAIVSESEARGLADNEAMKLIFRSEVSTSPTITAISGRGLGMAIVHDKVEKLGGHVWIQSQPQRGTTLRILLPLTLATFRGIQVSAAGQVFVVPTTHVERVLRIGRSDIQTVENRESISLAGKPLSLVRLQTVLEIANQSSPLDTGDTVTVMVLHSADQRMAFAVDDVRREEEVLVKPLRKPLIRVRNIAGATTLGSGKVALVLNVVDLMKSARMAGAAPQFAPAAQAPAAPESKNVLVVEDSITSRMLLKNILESAGYRVKTAVDGVDAFTALREEGFDLVVSDVEMPRMNGFDLTSRIRADKRLGELPVILITALESRDQRERGIDAGANAYVVKSSFDQQNLLEVIRRLI